MLGEMKTLLVMRHAKSDGDASYGGDHERPLNRRGIDAARHVGRHLGEEGLTPDLVISSTAVRARTSAELAVEAGGWECELRLEPGFYGASVESVVGIIAGVAAASRLMVVGHQPTWGSLVAHLTGESIEVRTATTAVIALPIEAWTAIPRARGDVVAVHHPPRAE